MLSNVIPKQTNDICKYYFDGDIEKSRSLQLKYYSLIKALFSDVNPIPVKEAMNMMEMCIRDSVIPFIGGEEEKSEKEPMKIFGTVENGVIKEAVRPNFTSQCIRVPVSDGHLASVFISFDNKPSKGEILKCWKEFSGEPQRLNLPSAPKQFLHYFEEDNMPQTKMQRDLEGGMAISLGRLREDSQYDYKFIGPVSYTHLDVYKRQALFQ